MIDVRAKKVLGKFVLDAELHDEGFICLTGKNGSGKSTFLNLVAGTLPLDEGSVGVNSKDLTRVPLEKRRIVLITPDSYIPHLTVDKHLLWGAKLSGVEPDPSLVEKVMNSLGIVCSGKVAKLSLGTRERVSLATALLSKPRLILVDETFSNIDSRDLFISEFRRLSTESGIEVIFTTQFQDDAKNADHQYLMEAGKMKKVF
jgi:molybdate/tungstate transport system ATP-binding protein